MSNSNNSNNIQSRSLWIGDIEYWMDEGFIIKIFENKVICIKRELSKLLCEVGDNIFLKGLSILNFYQFALLI
jgi:hypothetical protein